jgi:SOS-response transcriptional repressor LexA
MKPRDSQCEKALAFITGFMDQHQFAPSYPEIGKAMGLTSKSSVHAHIRHLVADKLVVIHGSRGAIPTKGTP